MSETLYEIKRADYEANARTYSFLVGEFEDHLAKAAERAKADWEEFLNGEAERPELAERVVHGED